MYNYNFYSNILTIQWTYIHILTKEWMINSIKIINYKFHINHQSRDDFTLFYAIPSIVRAETTLRHRHPDRSRLLQRAGYRHRRHRIINPPRIHFTSKINRPRARPAHLQVPQRGLCHPDQQQSPWRLRLIAQSTTSHLHQRDGRSQATVQKLYRRT